MGLMLNGEYLVDDPGPDTQKGGEFQRTKSTLRDWITEDGPYAPEAGRYHLFVAWNCPWAHRTLLARAMLGLQEAITISIAKPRRTDQGWVFDADGEHADPVLNALAVHEVYAQHSTPYTGRITVPVFWDKHTKSIVSNESADIVRMFAAFGDKRLVPSRLLPKIDDWNARIYAEVNNGVYRAGFARTQEAYDAAVTQLFETLDALDAHLSTNRYLCGDVFTEADLRLFPTLARFDVAYHGAFKCNLKRLIDYANLWPYAREIYQMPGVAETVKFDIYKQGYYSPSPMRNPLGIVPKGPIIDWSPPHGRG